MLDTILSSSSNLLSNKSSNLHASNNSAKLLCSTESGNITINITINSTNRELELGSCDKLKVERDKKEKDSFLSKFTIMSILVI